MSKEITAKITAVRVKKEDESVEANAAPDVDPLTLRIDSRPEGALEAVSEKITYIGAEGRKKVYVLVSFMPVEGLADGQPVTIERPVEFFIPSGQLSSEHQWITATMRSLSLAARGGYVTQALQDLRKVVWDKGVVRCGLNKWGKPMFHDSEVAAIAWSIQQILFRRGFLDEDGFQVKTEELVSHYARRRAGVTEVAVPAPATTTPGNGANAAPSAVDKSVGNCPECGGKMTLMDGCPTCVEGCGWSKCG